jgi:rsbT co-antagonist protein RsbR
LEDAQTFLKEQEPSILEGWERHVATLGGRIKDALTAEERAQFCKRILAEMVTAVQQGNYETIDGPEFEELRDVLSDLSESCVVRGITPSETAAFVFSLKSSMFEVYKKAYKGDELATRSWEVGSLIDQLGLFTFARFAEARERVIIGQAQSLVELSTPVIKVWDGIVALPLVGAVDSMRAKEIMEKLLDAVIAHNADVVIIDITGVPVFDTQLASRLMRTVEAVRLLGTKSIITGISPVIAQSLVQLGLDLENLNTKASLHAGLAQAFRDLGLKVTKPESIH